MLTRRLLALAALSTPSVHANAAATANAGVRIPAGFDRVLFYDDFSSGTTLDLSKWTYDTGTQYPGGPAKWGTGEVQTYTSSPDNIHITPDQTLRIVPLPDGHGGWTSARIEMLAGWDVGAAVGQKIRIEARIRLGPAPRGDQMGIWPAFWTLGSAYRGHYQNWPSVGEVDILETAHGVSRLWQTLHCGPTAKGGPCNEPGGRSKQADEHGFKNWNVFAWEMDRRRPEERMTWFVNDQPRFVLKQSDMGKYWGSVANTKMFLLLNVAVGGAFPDGIAGFRTPTNETIGGLDAAMEVDYVAVYGV
ncbi:Carbohydrate binding family 6 [Cordyceps militaris]|uniref:Carbohydrate binding family 6 n=1 Tax=Cordyceps militaris TaxID=73501 RepID=A0A2H4S766_CORMI|nr:Carbohydrate binding family 6 [Cordyceps militaris]